MDKGSARMGVSAASTMEQVMEAEASIVRSAATPYLCASVRALPSCMVWSGSGLYTMRGIGGKGASKAWSVLCSDDPDACEESKALGGEL